VGLEHGEAETPPEEMGRRPGCSAWKTGGVAKVTFTTYSKSTRGFILSFTDKKLVRKR